MTRDTGKAAAVDWKAIEADILSRLDLIALIDALGIRRADDKPRSNGWLSVHAIDRDDNNASAAICITGEKPGYYSDRGSGLEMNLWELAVRCGKASDWRAARAAFAAKAGVSFPSSHATNGHPIVAGTAPTEHSGRTACEAPAEPSPANPAARKLPDPKKLESKLDVCDAPKGLEIITQWSNAKAGISPDEVLKARGKGCRWKQHGVDAVALPAFDPPTSKLCGLVLFAPDGTHWEFADPKRKPEKSHTLAGSKDGLIIIGTIEDVAAAHTIIKCEGPTDALTLAAHLPSGFVAVTNAAGAGTFPDALAQPFADKDVWVVHDADRAGEEGAKRKVIPAIIRAGASSVKHVRLPYDIAPDHGKDLRDWFNEGHSFEELQAIAFETGPVDEATFVRDGTFSNSEPGPDGESSYPLPIARIMSSLFERTDGWPRRVGSLLFVHEGGDVHWFRNSSSLFGWLHHRCGQLDWKKLSGCVTKDELFHELQRRAKGYRAIEYLPHEPLIEDHYYACDIPEPGNGDMAKKLVGRFSPASDIDRRLIFVMFATLFWGGEGGARPMFLISSTDGRGAGKSKLTDMVSYLVGGHVELSQSDKGDAIRTRILSPEAMNKRVVRLDNLKSLRFSWSDLESMVTATVIGGHRMYSGEGSRPNIITYFLTLNNASLSTDVAQRSVIINVAKPATSGDWEAETKQFINDHRQQIIADFLGLLRRPAKQIARRSRWAAWQAEVLSKIAADPDEIQELIDSRSGESDVEAEEIDEIEDYFRAQLEWLGYDEASKVHIPSRVACEWYGAATNRSRVTTSDASRSLKQFIEEGRSARLSVNPSRTYGRGFIWSGPDANVKNDADYSLMDRAEQKRRDEKFDREARLTLRRK